MKIKRFLFENPPFKRKSQIFSSQIPHLSENHAFSLRESPIYAKITRFLFANPPFMWKTRVFSSKIPHLTRKSHIFNLQIPHLSEKHTFSLHKSAIKAIITRFLFRNLPFNPKITRFLFANPPFKRKSRVFSSEIPHLSENHAFSLRETNI